MTRCRYRWSPLTLVSWMAVAMLAIGTAGLAGCQPKAPNSASKEIGSQIGGKQSDAATMPAAGASATGGADRPMRVTPLKLARKRLQRSIELGGRTEAFEVAPLYANVTGYVSKVLVDIGQRVEGPKNGSPGTLLLEVVVPELMEQLAEKKALVTQSQAEIQQAEAAVRLAKAKVDSAEASLAEVRAAASSDEAQVVRWKSEYDRVEQLASTGVVTRKLAEETRAQYDSAEAMNKQAQAKIKAAAANVAEAQAGAEKSLADLTAQQARALVAEAELRRYEALVAYTQIHSPFDGIVVDRRVHTGHLVHAASDNSAALLTVMRIDPIRVVVDVPEADAVQIHDQSQIELRVPAMPLQSYAGTLTRSSWSLDTASRTLKAEVDLPNADGRWRPGMYLQAKLIVADRPDALAVPKSATFMQDKQSYCFVVGQGNRLERRPLTLGVQAGNEFEVLQGLQEGERIIAANPGAFREGQTVEITPAP